MPLVEVIVPEGSLSASERQSLIKDLSEAVLKAEGVPENAHSKSLTWVLVQDAPKGAWAIGGEPPAGLRFLTRISVPRGTLSVARKRRMGHDIYAVLSRRAGKELGPGEAWILINEVPDGHWFAGGKTLSLTELASFVGLDELKKRAQGGRG